MSSGENSRRFYGYALKFDKPYTFVPKICIFLTGAQFAARNNIIQIAQSGVNPAGLKMTVTTWYTSKLMYFRVLMVLGPKDTLYVGAPGFRVPALTHPLCVGTPPSQREVTLSDAINDPLFQSGSRNYLYGWRGFDHEANTNQRNFIYDFELGKTEVKMTAGVWYDTIYYQIELSYFIYVPKVSQPVFTPGCAALFSECNFGGDALEICDRVPSFPQEGWNKPVKSFRVPANKVLKVYQKELYKGKQVRIEEDQKCVEVLQFTFAQLLSAEIE